MPRVDDGNELGGGAIRMPGLYQRLLSRERDRVQKPDPQWRRGEPAPPEWMVKSRHLSHLEAGEPVRLASWELGGRSEPDERIYRLRQDRSITGWTVTPNDEVIPERGFDAED